MEEKREENNLSKSVIWQDHPLTQRNFKQTLALIILIFFTSIITYFVFDLKYSLLAFALLSISMGRYFLATTFILDEKGFTIRYFLFSKRRNWEQFVRYHIFDDGIFLSPFVVPSRLDSFRGEFLRFSRERNRNNNKELKERKELKEKIISLVQNKIKKV
ncbi:MAG: hypothetical protein HQK49_22490 [Oligoflexia bacterium]|nr:hypothetical protein [Oligoflexia bacterium]